MSAKANFTQFTLHHALLHKSVHHPSLIMVSAAFPPSSRMFSTTPPTLLLAPLDQLAWDTPL
eukprot:1891232-Prorocentrum_lima.AAC.1